LYFIFFKKWGVQITPEYKSTTAVLTIWLSTPTVNKQGVIGGMDQTSGGCSLC